MNKILFGFTCIFLAIGGCLLLRAFENGSAQVLLPSQLLTGAASGTMARVRVSGVVAAGRPVEYTLDPAIELKFSIVDPGGAAGKAVPVVYSGLKPNMFSAGRDVIIDGEFIQGTIIASRLLTQCPSKYEPPLVNRERGFQAPEAR